jgi:hypothetical protein
MPIVDKDKSTPALRGWNREPYDIVRCILVCLRNCTPQRIGVVAQGDARSAVVLTTRVGLDAYANRTRHTSREPKTTPITRARMITGCVQSLRHQAGTHHLDKTDISRSVPLASPLSFLCSSHGIDCGSRTKTHHRVSNHGPLWWLANRAWPGNQAPRCFDQDVPVTTVQRLFNETACVRTYSVRLPCTFMRSTLEVPVS